MAHSLPGGHGRDTQYLFGVQEPADGNNVVVAFTITSQSLKTEEDIFPLQFQVFKVCICLGTCSLWILSTLGAR